MSTALAEAVSAVLLLATLAGAVVRPWGWPEAVVAVPAAVVVIGIGAISLSHARAETEQLAPVIGFLAAVGRSRPLARSRDRPTRRRHPGAPVGAV